MKPDLPNDPEITPEIWEYVKANFYRPTTDKSFFTFAALIEARHRAAMNAAIMAAEKRGEEVAHAKMATLLKDPAAVRVNYLRGDIACQGLIHEAEEREREATLDAASSYLNEQYGYGMLSHPMDRARIAAIRNRGKP